MFIRTAQDLGNVVRDRRTELGLTQEQLAERVDKARQWIVRLESGHAGSANVQSLISLMAVLDLDVQLLPSDDDPDPMLWG